MSHSRSEELIADALALLHAHGFAPRLQQSGGRHIKIRWLDAGRRRTLVVSRSPSSNQARRQSRATLSLTVSQISVSVPSRAAWATR